MTAPFEGMLRVLSVDFRRTSQLLEHGVAGEVLDRGPDGLPGTAAPVGRAAVDAIPAAVKCSGRYCAEPQRDALPVPLAQE